MLASGLVTCNWLLMFCQMVSGLYCILGKRVQVVEVSSMGLFSRTELILEYFLSVLHSAEWRSGISLQGLAYLSQQPATYFYKLIEPFVIIVSLLVFIFFEKL